MNRKSPCFTFVFTFVLAGVFCIPVISAQGLARKWLQVRNTVTGQGMEDDFSRMALDAAGNVYTAGTSDDVRSKDWVLSKLAPGTGVPIWYKRFIIDGCSVNKVAAIAVDPSGNMVVTGYCSTPARSDCFTAKFSGTDGSLIWQKRYNGPGNSYDEGVAIQTDATGNAVVVANSIGSTGNGDIYTVKYSSAGAVVWEKRYNSPANSVDDGRDLKIDSAGNVLMTGASGKSPGSDYYTVKYAASSGTILWEARYNPGGDGISGASSIALDASGNAFVTGRANTSQTGEPDMATVKYAAASGQQLWVQRLNGTANAADAGVNIATDGAGNAIVLGYVQTSASNIRKERVLIKYSASTGALMWDKRETGAGYYDVAGLNRLTVDSGGNALITGNGYNDQSKEIFFTGKYASATGTALWENKYTWETVSKNFQIRHSGTAIAVDGSGNVVSSGISTSQTGDSDYYTIKYSPAGVILWSNRADGRYNRDDGPGAVTVDPAGNAINAGYTVSATGDEDIQVWKTDGATGALLWENRYVYGAPLGRDDRPIAVATGPNGDVYVAAQSDRANLNPEIYLAKHAAADGAILWQRRKLPTGTSYLFVKDMAVDAAGNVVVIGGCTRSNTGEDFYTVMYSPSGTILWEQFYASSASSSTSDAINAVTFDPAGNVMVTGDVTALNNSDVGITTIKYAAADGAKLWERAYKNPGMSRVTGIATDPQGNAIITGWSLTNTGTTAYTAKYASATGNLVWEKIYAAPSGTAQGRSVATDKDGNVVITGFQRSTRITSDNDTYTAKYAATNGSQVWERVYNGTFSADDRGQGVVIDSGNNVWITAISETAEDYYGIYSARYSGTDGTPLGSDFYDGRAPDSELPLLGAHAIAIGGHDRVAVTGPARPSGKDSDVATVLFEAQHPVLALERPAGTPVPGNGLDLGVVFASPPANNVTFTLRNTGSVALTISGISIIGADAGAFTVGNPSSANIAANGTATFTVGLISNVVGAHSATLRLTSNDPQANPLLVPLSYSIEIRNPLADDDHDGISNLIEYAFGLDPAANSAGQLPKFIATSGGQSISFTQPAAVTGITYGAEWSSTMISGSWQAVPDTGSGPDHLFKIPSAGYPAVFMRLKVTKQTNP